MLEQVITHIIAEMKSDIQDILRQNEDNRIRLGKIGELFVGRAIKYSLIDKGFSYTETNRRCTFSFKRQYGADSPGEHGVDFKVDIRDSSNKLHVFLVESKNWGTYTITPAVFNEEILSRFTGCDPEHRWHWMVTLNRIHIEDVGDLCNLNHIEIIPLEGQLRPQPNIEEILEPAIRSFVSNFIGLIGGHFTCNECEKPAPEKREVKTQIDEIREYIRRGVPDNVICRKFKISPTYLSKIKSMMRAKKEHIIDRRTKEANHYKKL
jgi:hypothetical protein